MIPRSTLRGWWTEQAACKGLNMELAQASRRPEFYEHRPADRPRLMICVTCPVLEQCTDWVFSEEDDPTPCHITAGMVPTERGRIRKQMRRTR
jgi:hypothetical protein